VNAGGLPERGPNTSAPVGGVAGPPPRPGGAYPSHFSAFRFAFRVGAEHSSPDNRVVAAGSETGNSPNDETLQRRNEEIADRCEFCSLAAEPVQSLAAGVERQRASVMTCSLSTSSLSARRNGDGKRRTTKRRTANGEPEQKSHVGFLPYNCVRLAFGLPAIQLRDVEVQTPEPWTTARNGEKRQRSQTSKRDLSL
jgi:hypothetical protein